LDKQIGEVIKRIRKSKKLTLKQLSDMTNLSVSYLSLLERGMTSSTIASLQRICDGLDVKMPELINHASTESYLMRSDERKIIFDNKKGVSYYNLIQASFSRDGVLMVIKNDEKNYSSMHSYDEIGYIIEGSMKIWLNDKCYELFKGDSMIMPAHVRQSFQKTSKEDCISVWIY